MTPAFDGITSTATSGPSGALLKPAPFAPAATDMATCRPHALWESPFVPTTRRRMDASSACASITTPAPTLASVATHMSASSVKEGTHPQPAQATETLDLHRPFTPIDVAQLEHELSLHPDKPWTSQLIKNLTEGARVGFTGTRVARTAPNLASAHLHPEVIDNELSKECSKGHIAGPYPTPPLPNLQCSGVGVVPKKNNTWRMIMHLSAPNMLSINDGINKEDYSLHYSSIDDATRLVAKLGRNCFLAKIDLKSAFRLIPIATSDWELLGIRWRDSYYVDKQLPFGLRSAPFLFNQLASALHWILSNNYQLSNLIHYLDDFLILERTCTKCQQSKHTMINLCHRLQIPLSWEKLEGPSNRISFLGIEIDTTAWVLRLPDDKLKALLYELTLWSDRKTCSKRQLLSLIGKLSYATKVMPAGRIFLRRLIDLSTHVRALHHHLHLNSQARADILWWHTLLPTWNGSAPILEPTWSSSSSLHLFTDASATHGFGAYYNGSWFRGPWLPHQQTDSAAGISITWQELYAIVVATMAWGHLWSGRRILFHCDNLAVVEIWRRHSSRVPAIMCLVRKLYFVAAINNFHVRVSHIQGTDNTIADALSRNDLTTFRKLAPNADLAMTTIPTAALELSPLKHEHGPRKV